jgi:hypothetical protein
MKAVRALPVRPFNAACWTPSILGVAMICRKLVWMLAVGDQIPDVRVWMAPQEPVSLRELAAEKPLLILFYLFDWSAT